MVRRAAATSSRPWHRPTAPPAPARSTTVPTVTPNGAPTSPARKTGRVTSGATTLAQALTRPIAPRANSLRCVVTASPAPPATTAGPRCRPPTPSPPLGCAGRDRRADHRLPQRTQQVRLGGRTRPLQPRQHPAQAHRARTLRHEGAWAGRMIEGQPVAFYNGLRFAPGIHVQVRLERELDRSRSQPLRPSGRG